MQLWLFQFNGSNNTKYAYETLELFSCLELDYHEALSKSLLNNSLINPRGEEGVWIELDLANELLFNWLKKLPKTLTFDTLT